MATHNQLGADGERIARDYLVAQGYALYTGNDRRSGAEIDIIAFRDDTIAFVEVKTRTAADPAQLDPMELVDSKRRSRMCRTADRFIESMNILHNPRFDIIVVAMAEGREPTVTHYEDAFVPDCR